ncbi:MAG: family 43 glycosylhydrolase [Butyrivibrio sp.]|nr:family 43 glycosylhydrolase [Butyrivibrio sp.]
MNLIEAIRNNDLEKVKEILIKEPAIVDGESFFEAARVGDIDVVKYFVEYSRISLNERDERQRSVLHYSALSNRADTFEYLVNKCGMSPFEGDKDLVTPWEMAVNAKSDKIINWLENRYNSKLEDYYHNPIRRGMYPDPSICRVGDDYYMVNSSFIFFPCIPISHSKDLINWEIIGYAITNPKWAHLDELEGGRGYWAPDISYYEEKFYITATYRLNDVPPTYRRQIVVSSDKPEGPYCEPSFIDEDGIDPSIFNDDDGRRYMLLNRGARILELDKTATRQISDASLLYYGDMKRAPEGPHLLKKDGYYYLILAEGGTGIGHRVTVARSKTLFGDYEESPYNPIMIQRDPNAAIQRCGHGDLVDTPDGRWYMVYLCGRQLEDKWSILGRETAIDPVDWTKDGWPIVNRGNGPSAMQLKPFRDYKKVSDDDLSKLSFAGLPMNMMTPRPFEDGGVEVIKDGNICYKLRGSRAPLSNVDSRNILLQRQTDFSFSYEALMSFEKMENGQNAGIIGYYDENTWISFGVIKKEDGYYLFTQEHIGDDDNIFYSTDKLWENDSEAVKDGITLKMDTDKLCRKFSYKLFDTNSFVEFNSFDNVYYLCDEGIKRGKRFTGALTGMYAYSGKEAEPLFADFKAVEYRPC